MSIENAARDAAAHIASWFDNVFCELDMLSTRISSSMIEAKGPRHRFVEADLKVVKPITRAFLAKHPFVEAAGVILAPGIIDEHRGTIEWWRNDDESASGKVIFNLTPDAGSFYDFENLTWFGNAVRTGARAITGPHVDFGGLDQYIMTLTAALQLGDGTIGMVGCDAEVRDIEAVLVPLLRRIPGDAALINADNRVVLGNSGRFLVGNRVRGTPERGGVAPVESPSLGLSVVYAEHSSYD